MTTSTSQTNGDGGSMRINRYLAHHGYATRRAADTLITQGLVTISGRTAVLGDTVGPQDVVEVRGQRPRTSFTYLAYHKPRGLVTHRTEPDDQDIASRIQAKDPKLQVFPVGRLDKQSRGLILVTDDVRIVEPLLSPERAHEKEYEITVQERLGRDFASNMEHGVLIGSYRTKPCRVHISGPHTCTVVLHEGKHHQIRRMCSALGYTVTDLVRTRIMHIKLGRLSAGTWRILTEHEQVQLLEQLSIAS